MIPGDCNADARIDISDAVCLLLFLFGAGQRGLPCGDGGLTAAANLLLLDHNDDGGVDLSDAISQLRALFAAGPPHPLGMECQTISGCPDVCRAREP